MNASVAVWPEADPSIVVPVPGHEELRAAVRQLVERHADHDAVRRAAESERGWNVEVWHLLNKDLQLGAMIVPEDLGGAGFGLRDLAVVLEETGAALLPEPVLPSLVLTPLVLSLADDATSVAAVLDAISTGDSVGTVALIGDTTVSGGRASGMLRRVIVGAACDLVVFGCAEGVFAVPTCADGVDAQPLQVLDSTRRQADIVLEHAEVVPLVGADRAEQVWARVLRAASIAAAAEHVGITRHQLEATVAYVSQRQQFGRPVGSFQAVKHRLADVLVDLERARSAVEYAAALYDEAPGAALAAEVAGAVSTDAMLRTVHEAVQLHGGIGFTWEHSAHYYVRRALGDEAIFGSARAHRRRIADIVGL